VYLCGHSLGGALAVLCWAFIVKNFSSLLGNLTGVYTYGQPHVGNQGFCSLVSQSMPSTEYIRFTSGYDAIPKVQVWWPHFGLNIHFLTEDGEEVENPSIMERNLPCIKLQNPVTTVKLISHYHKKHVYQEILTSKWHKEECIRSLENGDCLNLCNILFTLSRQIVNDCHRGKSGNEGLSHIAAQIKKGEHLIMAVKKIISTRNTREFQAPLLEYNNRLVTHIRPLVAYQKNPLSKSSSELLRAIKAIAPNLQRPCDLINRLLASNAAGDKQIYDQSSYKIDWEPKEAQLNREPEHVYHFFQQIQEFVHVGNYEHVLLKSKELASNLFQGSYLGVLDPAQNRFLCIARATALAATNKINEAVLEFQKCKNLKICDITHPAILKNFSNFRSLARNLVINPQEDLSDDQNSILEEFFTTADDNNNGYLTTKELQDAIAQLPEGIITLVHNLAWFQPDVNYEAALGYLLNDIQSRFGDGATRTQFKELMIRRILLADESAPQEKPAPRRNVPAATPEKTRNGPPPSATQNKERNNVRTPQNDLVEQLQKELALLREELTALKQRNTSLETLNSTLLTTTNSSLQELNYLREQLKQQGK